ncbi:hypothetical protein [Catenulispora rubra]|uniref:hypothetical protein n=1 Tax=Catenulispora rubra TaxID=280293 RepID=UPI0018924785|nr:hypothetical protein [Catenulispora rubra]
MTVIWSWGLTAMVTSMSWSGLLGVVGGGVVDGAGVLEDGGVIRGVLGGGVAGGCVVTGVGCGVAGA